MGLDDLREHGVLLPEEEWGERSLETTTPQLPLLALLVVAVVALVFGYVGDGGTTTWLALAVFLLDFFAIVWLCDRAVRKQRRQVEG